MTQRSDWLLAQLPMGMLDDDFFVRFVSLFQEVATTLLDGAANVENAVDVTVAPPELVRFLGSWLAVNSIDPSLPEGLQRQIVRQSGRNLAWRGTRRGLQGFLEVLTGAPAEIEETGGILREPLGAGDTAVLGDGAPWQRRVTIKVESVGWLSEEDFVSLVADEIPANVSWTLTVGDRLVRPAARQPEPLIATGGQTTT